MDNMKDSLVLTQELIDRFLHEKFANGLSPVSVEKLKPPLKKLYVWLGKDKKITASRLGEWREYIEAQGYVKDTVYTYIKIINNFLRHFGYDDLCIPKATGRKDIAGKQFGYLTAIEPTGKKNGSHIVWKCTCRCGNEIEVPATQLINMKTTSCGCLNIEILHFAGRFVDGTSLTRMMNDNPVSKRSASGYTGIAARGDKWRATIQYKKERFYLGTYPTIEEAIKARARAMDWIMEDVKQLYEATDHLYQEMPKRPPKPKKEPKPEKPVISAVRAKRDDNTSGCTGVTMQYGKWNASIAYQGYRYRLGAYEKLEDAIEIRKMAETYLAAGEFDKLKEICTNQREHHKR